MVIMSRCVAQDQDYPPSNVRKKELVPAMFVFGDSLIDNGNNNDLPSFAKANYFPYGIDFNAGPTGRFSNAYTIVDKIGINPTFLYFLPFIFFYFFFHAFFYYFLIFTISVLFLSTASSKN